LNGVTDGTRLSGPRPSKHAAFAHRHVSFHPPRDGVVERHGRLFGVLYDVGEKSALGGQNQLSEFGSRHLEIFARDPLEVCRRVHFTFRLSDDAADRVLRKLLKVDAVEDEEWSVGLTCHDEFRFVIRRSGGVGFVRDGVEHDEHFLGAGSEFETISRHDGVVSVVCDVTLTLERHTLDFRADVVNVSEN